MKMLRMKVFATEQEAIEAAKKLKNGRVVAPQHGGFFVYYMEEVQETKTFEPIIYTDDQKEETK